MSPAKRKRQTKSRSKVAATTARKGRWIDQEARRAAIAKRRAQAEPRRRFESGMIKASLNPAATYTSAGGVHVSGLKVRGRTYDAVITYNDVEGGRLHALTIYAKDPEAGIQEGSDLRVPLKEVTVEAVARAAMNHEIGVAVAVRRGLGAEFGGGGRFDAAIAAVVRQMDLQRRTAWTPDTTQLFLARYRELYESGEPAIHQRLATEFHISPSRSMTKLSQLRAELGEKVVPKAPTGRRGPKPKRRRRKR